MYIWGSTSQFCTRFQDFQHFGSLVSFLIKPESSEDLNLCAFEWMDIEDFQLQLIDFKASLLWTLKFVDLRKSRETIENKQKNILPRWKALQEKFSCLKKMAIALLSAFQATYLCEQIFSQMKVYFQCPSQPTYGRSMNKLCVQLSCISKYCSNDYWAEQGKARTRSLSVVSLKRVFWLYSTLSNKINKQICFLPVCYSHRWLCKTKHIKMLGTRSCLHLDIIRKLAHCVQKVADPWSRY